MACGDAAEPHRSCVRLRAPLRVPGKCAHLLRSLRSKPRRVRDAVGRHPPGAPMRLGLCGKRGSQGTNSPRGIDAPTFRLPPPREALRRDSPKLEERRRSQRVGTLRTAPSGERMTGAARRRTTIRRSPRRATPSRAFAKETMRSRPSHSRKLLRRPATRLRQGYGEVPPKLAWHSARAKADSVLTTLSRSSSFPACGAVSVANARLGTRDTIKNFDAGSPVAHQVALPGGPDVAVLSPEVIRGQQRPSRSKG